MKKNLTFVSLIAGLLSLASCTQPEAPKAYDLDSYCTDLPFEMPQMRRPEFPDNVLCLTEVGGVGDGTTDNTQAFAQGISQLSAQGGGTLMVTGGVWVTGPITFANNINLHLTQDAVIRFTPDYDAYPIVDCYFEGLKTKRCMAPLTANGCTNVAITGSGTIDGNGDAWRWVKRSKLTEGQWKNCLKRGGVSGMAQGSEVWAPTQPIIDRLRTANMNVPTDCVTDEDWQAARDFLRPVLLEFDHCTNVLLEGVCFQNSPAWNLHPFMCENVIISNVMVINPWYSQNGDGLDLEACKNALIVNSKFDVGDDAICVKSGKDKDGRDLQTPCENVVVSGCAVYHGHGGFVVGSEMSSGIKNVSVRNCSFLGTDVGLRFKSKRGRGGIVENIHIENISMIDIPTECILFDMHYSGLSASEEKALGMSKNVSATDLPAVDETTPVFRDIYISDVVCQGAERAMYFNGIPEMPISNINITRASITASRGIEINHSVGINISDLSLNLPEGVEELQTYNVKDLNIQKAE